MERILDLTEKDAKNIFTKAEVLRGIKKLENFEWPKYDGSNSIEEFIKLVDNILTEKMGSFPTLVRSIQQDTYNFPIFRAREVTQVKNERLIAEFSYPPLSVSSMGRCNFPGHPVFYASNSPLTAILEAFKESNFQERKLYLSLWSIIPNKEIFYFESFLRGGLNEKSFYHKFNDNLKDDLQKTFKALVNEDQILGMLEYLKFVDSQFTSDETYSISASLAHRRLYFPGNITSDIIMYPSVKSNRNEANFAIHPNFVDNNMRLDKVYEISLDNFDVSTNTFSMTFHRYGFVSKSAILWDNNTEDKRFRETVKKDFGAFIAAEKNE